MQLTKSLIPTMAVLILSLGSAVAEAAPKALLPQMIAQTTEGKLHQAPHWDKIMQELNLTSEQTQKIQAIRTQYKDQIAQRHQAFLQAKRELKDLMIGTASEDQVREKHSQVEALEQQVRKPSLIKC
jgi:Spy/CpxP family protein refolding chaperone